MTAIESDIDRTWIHKSAELLKNSLYVNSLLYNIHDVPATAGQFLERVNYLAQSFAPVKVTPEAAHSIICQAVQGLSPGGKYINLRQADCTSR